MNNNYKDFIKQYPTYESTAHIDVLRAEEYGRIDRADHVYLDYTGGGLYAESQVKSHQQILLENTFGNPHSTNPASLAATQEGVYLLLVDIPSKMSYQFSWLTELEKAHMQERKAYMWDGEAT